MSSRQVSWTSLPLANARRPSCTPAYQTSCLATPSELNLFDNKFSDTPEVLKAIRELFANNTTLSNYDLAGNQISDEGASKLIHGLLGNTHIEKARTKALSMLVRHNLRKFTGIIYYT